ncbi:DoxX family protein [Yeosuana marina]|uniref:DoxX family protein n=1 Tax=Yeosuana marina TaxID=1565536 RepID=UPI001421C0F0|nr:DoxX family protein [Yeosuana marina]
MNAFSKSISNQNTVSIVLLITRLAVAFLMINHGYPKLTKLLEGGEIQFADPLGVGVTFSLILAVFAEFLCSILIGLGLFIRLATIPLMITMFVAAFIVHGADPIARKELAILYLVLYIMLFVFEGGKFSLDYFVRGKKA